MQDLKDFIVFALKNPLLWGVAIAWVAANLKWLVPSAPPEVIESAIDLFTIIGVIVVAYLGGQNVERKRVDRFYARQRLAQQNLVPSQELPHG
jgi:hypothetical protein